MKASSKPQWKLKSPFGEGTATKWREVGAAWNNPDGSINVVLNAYVSLTYDRKYILFVNNDEEFFKNKKNSKPVQQSHDG